MADGPGTASAFTSIGALVDEPIDVEFDLTACPQCGSEMCEDASHWTTVPLADATDFDDESDCKNPERQVAVTESAIGVGLDDFHAYMPMHAYLFAPSRELWPATSVNARIPPVAILDSAGNPVLDDDGKPKRIRATAWLDEHRAVEQMTWIPGMPMLIAGRLVSEGGWIERPGCATFNLYRAPCIDPGDARRAGPWLDHVRRIYPHDADHILDWLAHRRQRPQDKVNHALVLGGPQGIGKDTLLEPVKHAIGPWNFIEVSPAHLLGRFNGFAKSVILRVSEAVVVVAEVTDFLSPSTRVRAF